jgi:hypothetical protein
MTEIFCCFTVAVAREWDPMCPSRVRGLAKQRPHSLHVKVMQECSSTKLDRSKNGDWWHVEE